MDFNPCFYELRFIGRKIACNDLGIKNAKNGALI